MISSARRVVQAFVGEDRVDLRQVLGVLRQLVLHHALDALAGGADVHQRQPELLGQRELARVQRVRHLRVLLLDHAGARAVAVVQLDQLDAQLRRDALRRRDTAPAPRPSRRSRARKRTSSLMSPSPPPSSASTMRTSGSRSARGPCPSSCAPGNPGGIACAIGSLPARAIFERARHLLHHPRHVEHPHRPGHHPDLVQAAAVFDRLREDAVWRRRRCS